MGWKEIGSKIAEYAPLLGGIVGGPAGSAAGTGVKLLASAFGLKPSEVTADKVEHLLLTDPDAAIKIREIEANNKLELQKLNIAVERMRLDDVADARARETAIVRATGKKDINLYVIAWTVLLGFFVLCGLLMYIELPEGSSQVVFMLFGSLSTGFGTVLAYFFGSSKSSADKTVLLSGRNGGT